MITGDKIAVSAREAARLLGMRPATVLDLIRDGSIPARRLGSRWVIGVAAIEQWLVGGVDPAVSENGEP